MPDFPFPLMIFAAGFGTRMGRLTADRPKQRWSSVMQRCAAARAGSCCHQVAALEPAPCSSSTVTGPWPWLSA